MGAGDSLGDSQLPLFITKFITAIRSNTIFDFMDLGVLAGVLCVIGTDFCSRKVIFSESKIQLEIQRRQERRSIALTERRGGR